MTIPEDQPAKFVAWWQEQGLRKPQTESIKGAAKYSKRVEIDAKVQEIKDQKEIEGE